MSCKFLPDFISFVYFVTVNEMELYMEGESQKNTDVALEMTLSYILSLL